MRRGAFRGFDGVHRVNLVVCRVPRTGSCVNPWSSNELSPTAVCVGRTAPERSASGRRWRSGLSSSTSFSNGMSWLENAPSATSRTCVSSSRNDGSSSNLTRKASVLTKNPISPRARSGRGSRPASRHHDVLLPAVARQQHRESRQQRHEQRRALPLAERLTRSSSSTGSTLRTTAPRKLCLRRPWPVARQAPATPARPPADPANTPTAHPGHRSPSTCCQTA